MLLAARRYTIFTANFVGPLTPVARLAMPWWFEKRYGSLTPNGWGPCPDFGAGLKGRIPAAVVVISGK